MHTKNVGSLRATLHSPRITASNTHQNKRCCSIVSGRCKICGPPILQTSTQTRTGFFPTVYQISYHNLHNTDLDYAASLLLCYWLGSNQLRPLVQLRPAPLCRGRLLHIYNKTLSLHVEANGLGNCSPWLCLLLPWSKNAQWSLQWTSKVVAIITKTRCYGSSPFWSAASRDQPHPQIGQRISGKIRNSVTLQLDIKYAIT